MRGRIFLALFVVSGMLVSCDFQQEYGQDVQISSYDDVDVVLNASVADDFNGILDYLWAEDKVMHLRLSGSSYGSLEDCDELVAVKEDGKIKFQGVLPSYREDDNFFLYYASDISFSQDDSLGFVKTVASEQSGRLKDVVKHALYYSWIRNDYAVKGYSDGSLNLETQLAPMFSLLKINIPEQLQVKNLKIETEAPVTGQMHIHPQRGWGRTGEGCFLYRPEDEMTTFIKLSQGDDVAVSGDLYLVVVPDAYDEILDCYYSSMDSFVLSCSSSEGPIRYRYTVDDIVRNGSVVDLGKLAVRDKKDVNVGQICLTSDVSPTVAIKNPYPDFEFYYELGDSEGFCAKPTVDSERFDPTAGFRPTIKGSFDRYFIKILAHSFYTDCKDVVMTASLRHWKFDKECPTAAVYRDAADLLATNPSKVNTTDGLIVRRRATAALKYTETAGQIEFNNCIVPFMPVEQQSDVYMYMMTSNKSNIKDMRTINLFYIQNGSTEVERVNEFNGNETRTTILRQETAAKVSVVWNLGTLAGGYELAFAPDNKSTYFAQAILEVL